ncbi:hypothetical protein [Schaedlerella sp.]|uniref:hypothetical protein n=1 Tax=Schaedlerella sp. TaxID=2676057 RepID=UPI0037463DB8
MPLSLQYISFFVSILGFIITIGTFIMACRVNKKILRLRESENFHINRQEIIDKLEGYIRSITADHLHESDSGKTLRPDILMHLTDIKTKYTHLSPKTKEYITDAETRLNRPSIDWLKVARILISLRNSIDKEI